VKTRSTQRKNSAVTRASQSAGRADCRAWSGGIAALLAEQICQTASHKSADAGKLQTVSAKSPVPISATLSRKSTGQKYATASRISFVGLALHSKAQRPAFGNYNDESQRDSGSKPKVARDELPWVSASHVNNPNGVVARRRNRGTTPLGLRTFTATTQGSSCLATLGWMTQSLWDCSSKTIPVRAGFLCDGSVIVSRKLVKTPDKSGKSYVIPKPGILKS
jgi:hypothetical protein